MGMRIGRTLVVFVALIAALVACGGAADAPGPVAGSGSPSSGPAASPVAVERPPATSPDVADLVSGLNQVGYDLFGVATEGSNKDVVLSPLSIGLAFGMADVGATGPTAESLEELFGYPVDGEARWSAFNTLDRSVTDVGEPIVRLANRQFPDESFDTVEGYDERLARWFGSGIEPLPLQTQPEASRARINEWVAERTEQLIPELVPQGMINPNSVMVLVNALYLEADWARQFGKYPTEDAPFTRLDGSTVTVPLMHELELTGPAVDTDTYAATEVPYEDEQLSMLVIVPRDDHYRDVEERLPSVVDEIDATAGEGSVELWLPRFDSDTNLDLREALEGSMGVSNVFGGDGQWDGIAPEITLESAVHAADISVDEYGTVAAAATALGFDESGPPAADVTIRADRPFLYLIRHTDTGAVLFVGRVMDPSA